MMNFHQYAHLGPLFDTQPELWRELYGCMAVCRKELDDYGKKNHLTRRRNGT